MFDGHEDLFFSQTTNQSRPRTDSLGKSNKGQNLDQNINERRIVLWSCVIFDIIIIRIFDDSSVCSSSDLSFVMFGFENQG